MRKRERKRERGEKEREKERRKREREKERKERKSENHAKLTQISSLPSSIAYCFDLARMPQER